MRRVSLFSAFRGHVVTISSLVPPLLAFLIACIFLVMLGFFAAWSYSRNEANELLAFLRASNIEELGIGQKGLSDLLLFKAVINASAGLSGSGAVNKRGDTGASPDGSVILARCKELEVSINKTNPDKPVQICLDKPLPNKIPFQTIKEASSEVPPFPCLRDPRDPDVQDLLCITHSLREKEPASGGKALARILSDAMGYLRFNDLAGEAGYGHRNGTGSMLLERYSVPWIYLVSLEGDIAIYPGTSSLPADYDPKTRPWFKRTEDLIRRDLKLAIDDKEARDVVLSKFYFTPAYTDVFSKTHTFVSTLCTPLHSKGWEKNLFNGPKGVAAGREAIMLCVDVRSRAFNGGRGFFPSYAEIKDSVIGYYTKTLVFSHNDFKLDYLIAFVIFWVVCFLVPPFVWRSRIMLVVNAPIRGFVFKGIEVSSSGVKASIQPARGSNGASDGSSSNGRVANSSREGAVARCDHQRTFPYQIVARRHWFGFGPFERIIVEGPLTLKFRDGALVCDFRIDGRRQIFAVSNRQWVAVKSLFGLDPSKNARLAELVRWRLHMEGAQNVAEDFFELDLDNISEMEALSPPSSLPPPGSFQSFLDGFGSEHGLHARLERMPVLCSVTSLRNLFVGKKVKTVLLGSFLIRIIEEESRPDLGSGRAYADSPSDGGRDKSRGQDGKPSSLLDILSGVFERADSVVRYVAIGDVISERANDKLEVNLLDEVSRFREKSNKSAWATRFVKLVEQPHSKDFAVVEDVSSGEKILVVTEEMHVSRNLNLPIWGTNETQKEGRDIVIKGYLSWRCDDLEEYQNILLKYESATGDADLQQWLAAGSSKEK